MVTGGTLEIPIEPLLVNGSYLRLWLVEGLLEKPLMVQRGNWFLEEPWSGGVALREAWLNKDIYFLGATR